MVTKKMYESDLNENILVSDFSFINGARGLRLALGVAHPLALLTFPEGGKPSLWLRSLHEVSWPG